jgi:hypothetical protein
VANANSLGAALGVAIFVLSGACAFAQESLPPAPDPANLLAEEPPADDLAERLKALEEAWTKHQEQLTEDEEKAAEEKEKKELELKQKPTFKIGGRIHADIWTFPETDPGIDFFELFGGFALKWKGICWNR